jgi:hypothetical protein
MLDPSAVRCTVSARYRQSHRRRHRRHHDGQRAAVRRAVTGARLSLGLSLDVHTQGEAAAAVAVSLRHVTAAVAVLKAEDAELLGRVLTGEVSLRAAARNAGKRGSLIAAYRQASPEDRLALARTVGPDVLWDETLAPVLV